MKQEEGDWDYLALRRGVSGEYQQCIQVPESRVWRQEIWLFSLVSSDRTRGNGHKLKCRRFSFSSCEDGWILARRRKEAVKCPSLDIFKSYLDMALDDLLYVALLEQGSWSRWPPGDVDSSLGNCEPESQCYRANLRHPRVSNIQGYLTFQSFWLKLQC